MMFQRILLGPLMAVVLAACTAGFPELARADGDTRQLTCEQIPALFQLMTAKHYARGEVEKNAPERAAERFLNMLDPSKSIFLEDEAQRIKTSLTAGYGRIQKGRCDAFVPVAELVRQRAREDLTWVKEFLNDSYTLDPSATITVDAERRKYPKTSAERQKRLQNLIHFQIASQLDSGVELKTAKEMAIHRYTLALKRIEERREVVDMPELYANAFASALDPHSSYLSQEVLEDFQIEMSLSLEGIGATLRSEDGFTVVESLVPGGQADKEGRLRPEDKIVAVAQEGETPVSVIDMDLRDVVKLIRGPKGTTVRLTVLRSRPEERTLEIRIVRDKIDVKEQAAKIEYREVERDGKKLTIAVLELPSFYGGDGGRSSYSDVKALLAEASKRNVDGLVLDLSQNGGGLLEDAVRIAGLFIRSGPVVATRQADGDTSVLTDPDPAVQYHGPLAVLVSPASASASEILAGALQSYGRAVIVGSKQTFGKGSVQQIIPLSSGVGALKLTTGMFYVPSGESTQRKGVTSDVVIPSLFDGYNLGEHALHYALPAQKIQRFNSGPVNSPSGRLRWEPVGTSEITHLQERSRQRVAGDAELAWLTNRIAELRADDASVSMSVSQARAKNQNSKGKNRKGKEVDVVEGGTNGKSDAKSELDRAHAAVLGEATAIVADLVSLRTRGYSKHSTPASEHPRKPL